MMDLDSFLTLFKEKRIARGATFGTLKAGALREIVQFQTRAHCPLSFVAGTTHCIIAEAQRQLGLGEQDAIDIANAADNAPSDRLQELRKKLLKAAGCG